MPVEKAKRALKGVILESERSHSAFSVPLKQLIGSF